MAGHVPPRRRQRPRWSGCSKVRPSRRPLCPAVPLMLGSVRSAAQGAWRGASGQQLLHLGARAGASQAWRPSGRGDTLLRRPCAPGALATLCPRYMRAWLVLSMCDGWAGGGGGCWGRAGAEQEQARGVASRRGARAVCCGVNEWHRLFFQYSTSSLWDSRPQGSTGRQGRAA